MPRKKAKVDDDVTMDLSSVKAYFTRFTPQQLIAAGLILFCLILVFSIRMLPAALPVTDAWAEQSIRQNLQNQFAQQISQSYPSLPAESRDRDAAEQAQQYIDSNPGEISAAKQQISEQFRQAMRYEAGGKQYTYLGDLDSYYWLRYTRNWLNTGSVCDAVTPEGQCRDMFVLAPVGQPVERNPSSHVFAIGLLYQFISLFDPEYPLLAASFLIPVLAGILGVFPAFFIGRRLAGNVGGFFAAILISIHPLYLSRSIGSDNDAWNVVIPLFVMWLAIEALDAKSQKSRITYAALAGLAVAVHATFWGAYWFIYLIVLFALLGYFGFTLVRAAVKERSYEVWKDKKVQLAGIVLGVFYIAAMLFLFIFGQQSIPEYVSLPRQVMAASAGLDEAIQGSSIWPNVLTTVAELNQADLAQAVSQMGGKWYFFASLLGLLLMMLPRDIKRWQWEHYALIAVGGLISLYLVSNPTLGKFTTLFLLGLPILLIIVLDLLREYDIDVGAAFVVLVWMLATVYATYSGIRFILLLIPAYGVTFAVTIGRIFDWFSEYANKEFSWDKRINYVAIFILLALVLITPVQSGKGTAENFIPSIDDAWWDTLVNIRENSDPNAVINSWWDFGHWFKYIAERRVSADGTTQNTHVPYWLGKSLVTTDERESIGILRMLNCGSDAFPTPEGEFGAYGRVLDIVNDELRAQRIVLAIVNMDRDDAEAYLEEEGFTSEQRTHILEATHCPVVEDYYITSGDMVGKGGVWAHFGLWDFEKAEMVQTVQQRSQGDAVQYFVSRFGMTEQEARQRYGEIISLMGNEGAINQYVSPWPGFYTSTWRACSRELNDTVLLCQLGLGVAQNGATVTAIDSFALNLTSMNESALFFGTYQNGVRVQTNQVQPARLVIADNTSLKTLDLNASTSIGVLIDTVNNRVLIADPHHVGSVFAQLYYLEGRYNEHFELFSDRTSFSGSRILTWKVDWEGP